MAAETAEATGAGRFAGLDARSRLVAALALVVTIVALRTPEALAAAVAAGLGLAIAGRVPAGAVLRRMLHLEGFVLLLFVGLPLVARDGPWVAIGPLSVSLDGLALAATVALRITAAGLVLLALLNGLSPVAFGHGLVRLGAPTRIVELLFFTFRYLELIDGESRRLREAMRLRAFEPRTDLHTLKTYGQLIGQMLVRSFERAERVAEAMRCRGFAGRFPLIADERFGRSDLAFVFVAAALAALLAGVEIWCRIR